MGLLRPLQGPQPGSRNFLETPAVSQSLDPSGCGSAASGAWRVLLSARTKPQERTWIKPNTNASHSLSAALQRIVSTGPSSPSVQHKGG